MHQCFDIVGRVIEKASGL